MTPLNTTARRLPQFMKAVAPMEFTFLPSSTHCRAEQPLNADSPMPVTASGIFTLRSFVQELNAPASIVVTVEGIVTDVRSEHPESAFAPMTATGLPPSLTGITRSFFGFGETAVEDELRISALPFTMLYVQTRP